MLNNKEHLLDRRFATRRLYPQPRRMGFYAPFDKKDKFAFSFSWSGAAVVDLMASNENYKFFIHPRLSYISSDLIAQTSEQYGALCVAKFLSSKEITAKLQQDNYYFSPYKDKIIIKNSIYQQMYKKFLLELPSLTWIASSNTKDFQDTNQSWQLIKLSLTNQMNSH